MRSRMKEKMGGLLCLLGLVGLGLSVQTGCAVSPVPSPAMVPMRVAESQIAWQGRSSAGVRGDHRDYAAPMGASTEAMLEDRGGRLEAESLRTQEETKGQLLIYTGSVVLAIYDVASIQERAVALVDEMEGYVAHRSNERLVVRVPAALFRETLDELSALGDVLDLSWQAQDVSEEVRDLDIRLRNARELRNRLETLLERAESVEDALKIETELERITLEIERIRGQLLRFEDRIAYSTIEVVFQPRQTEEVPDDEFLLPFRWLNQLGLQSLFRESEVRR